jgi:hypothetical protein
MTGSEMEVKFNINDAPYNQLIMDFPLIGLYRFRMEQLQDLNLHSSIPLNESLAGHIENENVIVDLETINLINELVTPVVEQYDKFNLRHREFVRRVYNPEKLGYPALSRVWVNRQKKYEFNPIHDHSGIYSFVIWYKIPYTAEEERKASPFKGDPYGNTSGVFEYITKSYDEGSGRLASSSDWNGTMAIFPAETPHCVYPFYSTDEERITIAGNYHYFL